MVFSQLLKTTVLDNALRWNNETIKDVFVVSIYLDPETRKMEIVSYQPILELSIDQLRRYIEDENYSFVKIYEE